MRMKKVLIIGGHLAPALAVIEELQTRGGWDIVWVGRRTAMEGEEIIPLEYSVIPEMNIPFHSIETGRLQRKFTNQTITSLLKVPVGFLQSLRILQKVRPDVVLSFGGYLSVPVVAAAAILGVPIIVHEQTTTAGLANRFGALLARKVAISFEVSKNFFPSQRVVLTGNPVRKEIFSIKRNPSLVGGRRLLYITGGNQGSKAINESIKKILPELVKKFFIIHQTGFLDYEHFRKVQKNLGKYYRAYAIIEPIQVEKIFSNASLVISRAGANTISELAIVGIPSILIPLPWSGSGEQEKNAWLLASTGLSKVIMQDKLTPVTFLKTILEIIQKPPSQSVRKKSRALINPDAAKQVVNLLDQAV